METIVSSEADVVELRIHMNYMRDAVEKIVERMDSMPTAQQLQDLQKRLDKIEQQQATQTKLMDTLVTLERFAKWFSVVAAAVGTAYASWRAFKGG